VTKPAVENNAKQPDLDSPSDDSIVTVDTLAAHDLTPTDVRRLWPWATPYIALDGRPCWRASELHTVTSTASQRRAA
jgi:hypothetical protein